jgi:hypothetical protein
VGARPKMMMAMMMMMMMGHKCKKEDCLGGMVGGEWKGERRAYKENLIYILDMYIY